MEIPTFLEIAKDLAIASIGFIFYAKSVIQKKTTVNKNSKKNEIIGTLEEEICKAEELIEGHGGVKKQIVLSNLKEKLTKNQIEFEENEIEEKIEKILKTPQATIYKMKGEKEKDENKEN